MLVRSLISKIIVPTLESDLSRSVALEMSAVGNMVDNMLAPQAFAYESSRSNMGAFQGSTTLHQAHVPVVKAFYPIKSEGLFADKQLSFHATKK